MIGPRSYISGMKDDIPIGRVGNADDTVGTVIYLASKAGSLVSGTVIIVRASMNSRHTQLALIFQLVGGVRWPSSMGIDTVYRHS